MELRLRRTPAFSLMNRLGKWVVATLFYFKRGCRQICRLGCPEAGATILQLPHTNEVGGAISAKQRGWPAAAALPVTYPTPKGKATRLSNRCALQDAYTSSVFRNTN
jgi:hypothetical protein